MPSKKNRKLRSHKKSHRGGFFFSKNAVKPYPGECDVNRLTSLKTSNDIHQNYQKCCPKGMFGTKNSSPYCKQLDLNFQAAMAGEKNANDYEEYEPKFAPTQLSKSQYEEADAQKKPWYKFWGGKKSKRKNRRGLQKRKRSRTHRK